MFLSHNHYLTCKRSKHSSGRGVWLVKYYSGRKERACIYLGATTIYFPLQYLGKRVRFKVEVVGDEVKVPVTPAVVVERISSKFLKVLDFSRTIYAVSRKLGGLKMADRLDVIAEIKKLSSEIERIGEENRRLLSLKERYVENASRLRKLGEDILEMAKCIDPVSGGFDGNERKGLRGHYDEIIQDLYGKMQSGLQVTMSLLDKVYSNLDYKKKDYVLKKLAALPNVEKAKDGVKVRLFRKDSVGNVTYDY